MYVQRRPEECVTICDLSKAYGGYTLFAQHTSTDAWLIDMRGHIVHHWKLPHPPGGPIRLLPNGNQIRLDKTLKEPTAHMGTAGGNLVEVDWNGNVVWKYEDQYMHHDFCRLENGNTLINRHVLIPPQIAARVKGGIPGTELKEGMWGDSIQEITPEGKVVWEWLGYEYMDPEIDVLCPLCTRSIWAYVNGLDAFPNGDLVLSVRHLNNLIVIDKKTKAIKQRWGHSKLGHQHNPTVLGNNNVLVFDNGYHRLPPAEAPVSVEGNSQVLEVNLESEEIEWQYKDPTVQKFFSPFCSGAGRLPNGNTLICESSKGRIFEVTSNKELVWEFFNPFYENHDRFGLTNHIFQAHRYGYDYSGLQGKTLHPDRFEFVVQDKAKKDSTETPDRDTSEESPAQRRLRMLGY
jgi:hypothetical protein